MLTAKELQQNIEIIKNLDSLPIESLEKYQNWGAFSAIIKELEAKLQECKLPPETIEAVKEASLTSYFTDERLIKAIWNIITESVKVEDGIRILDPCCGTGNFFRFMPESLKSKATLVGIEKEPFSAKIAQRFLPNCTILNIPFEEFICPDNYFHIAIGNVPFSQMSIKDNRYKALSPKIHESFILKMKDLVCENGLVIAIVPKGFLNQRNNQVRDNLSKYLNLVYAPQLPCEIFMESSSIKIATDLVIFQKKKSDCDSLNRWKEVTIFQLDHWESIKKLKKLEAYTSKRFPSSQNPEKLSIDLIKEEESININEYHLKKKALILGQFTIRRNRFNRPEIDITANGKLEEIIQRIANIRLPQKIRERFQNCKVEESAVAEKPIYYQVKPGKFYLINGNYVYRSKGKIQINHCPEVHKSIEKMHQASTTINRIYEIYNTNPEELNDKELANLNKELEGLQKVYREFFYQTAIHWFRIEKKKGNHILSHDSDYYLIKSTFDKNEKLFDLFNNWRLSRVNQHYSSVDEIYEKCLVEKGKLDLEWITKQAEKYLAQAS